MEEGKAGKWRNEGGEAGRGEHGVNEEGRAGRGAGGGEHGVNEEGRAGRGASRGRAWSDGVSEGGQRGR